jgi:hypothetical protein
VRSPFPFIFPPVPSFSSFAPFIYRLSRFTCSGHVSAITVSPSHRRLGLASMMMDLLEAVSERENGYLCDPSLFLLPPPSSLLCFSSRFVEISSHADPVFSSSQRRSLRPTIKRPCDRAVQIPRLHDLPNSARILRRRTGRGRRGRLWCVFVLSSSLPISSFDLLLIQVPFRLDRYAQALTSRQSQGVDQASERVYGREKGVCRAGGHCFLAVFLLQMQCFLCFASRE